MKILVVTDNTGYMRGGVPAETRRLIIGLARSGHTVALAGDVPLADTGDIQHFPINIPVRPSLPTEVGQALSKFKPDFVHVMCMSSKGVMSLASLLRGLPWALTVHSVPPFERKLQGWHGNEYVHYAARALRFSANRLAWQWIFGRALVPMSIVHSQFVKDIVCAYGASRDAVRLIPLAFESSVSSPVTKAMSANIDAPLLVTVGGFSHSKGQHDVVKALPRLVTRFPGLRYQIIGEVRDESYVRYLRRLAHNLGVSDHFIITPDLDNATKLRILEETDVYIQPSHEEGFCLAYAEAAAIVTRLVGTDAGAIASMSEGDAGSRLVPVRTPPRIASAVEELIRTEMPRFLMSERATRMSERFSASGYLRLHENLYASMQHPPAEKR